MMIILTLTCKTQNKGKESENSYRKLKSSWWTDTRIPWTLQFSVRVLTFLSLILCYLYFGPFLSTWLICKICNYRLFLLTIWPFMNGQMELWNNLYNKLRLLIFNTISKYPLQWSEIDIFPQEYIWFIYFKMTFFIFILLCVYIYLFSFHWEWLLCVLKCIS